MRSLRPVLVRTAGTAYNGRLSPSSPTPFMPLPTYRTLTFEVAESDLEAFQAHVDWFFTGDAPMRQAATLRQAVSGPPSSESGGACSCGPAGRRSSGSEVIRDMLGAIERPGEPFDLSRLTELCPAHRAQSLALLRAYLELDTLPARPPRPAGLH